MRLSILLAIVWFITFAVSYYSFGLWHRFWDRKGYDVNKISRPEVTESGGTPLIMVLYSVLMVLYFITMNWIFAAVMFSIGIAGVIGFIDDHIGSWKQGLKQWQKVLISFLIPIPILTLGLNHSILGINFGVIFPIILMIAIVGTANGFNMLAGFNGLECGMASLIIYTLGMLSLLKGNMPVFTISVIALAGLTAFMIVNKYPAQIFPGDSFTYAIGALIGIIAILAELEVIALILFTPYLIEAVIKAKNRFKSECFGIPQADGTLKAPDKIGSLTHIFMRYFKTEKSLVMAILIFEALICLIVSIIVVLL